MQNDELNEKSFDLEQRIAQMDLEISMKVQEIIQNRIEEDRKYFTEKHEGEILSLEK